MVSWIHNHIFLLACLAVGLAIPQILGVCISRILLLQIKDQKFYYEKVPQVIRISAEDEVAEESNV